MQLSDQERELFQGLTKLSELYNSTLRVAGGWVRDKIIGLESENIDMIIEGIPAEEFAQRIREHMQGSSKVGIIRANPEVGKPIKTACIRVHGRSLDIANIREGESPEQDAFRRDLTINSLFYNLHTSQIEDFTGLGRADIREKVARTPTNPELTFQDDPLRALRLIRFVVKYKLTIHEELEHCLSSAFIKDALKSTVRRERVGHEWVLMMKGPDPRLALQLVEKFEFTDCVFLLPEGIPSLLREGLELLYRCNSINLRISIAAVALHYKDVNCKGKDVGEYLCLEALRLSKKDAQSVAMVVQSIQAAVLSLQSLEIFDIASVARKTPDLVATFTIAQAFSNAPQHTLESVYRIIEANSLNGLYQEKLLLSVRYM